MLAQWIDKWLELGRKNLWIREAWDPPFDAKSFAEVTTLAELKEKFRDGCWSLGVAFSFGDLCFINQVDGGDEWLTIRRDIKFESCSMAAMIKRGKFETFIADIQAATDDELRKLDYEGVAGRAETLRPDAS